MLKQGRTMHVYSADETIYYGNIMFEYIIPKSEEEWDDFIKDTIREHFPQVVGKPYHIVWSDKY